MSAGSSAESIGRTPRGSVVARDVPEARARQRPLDEADVGLLVIHDKDPPVEELIVTRCVHR